MLLRLFGAFKNPFFNTQNISRRWFAKNNNPEYEIHSNPTAVEGRLGIRVIILGTASSRPSIRRSLPCIAVQIDKETLIFEAGEGAQLQIQKAELKLAPIRHIFITHLHGDHIFGLPGLLLSLLHGTETGCTNVYGPLGLKEYLKTVLDISTGYNQGPWYHVEELENISVKNALKEIKAESVDVDLKSTKFRVLSHKDFSVDAYPLNHTVPCFGYIFEEYAKSGNLDAKKVADLGLPPGPLYRDLKKNIPVKLPSGRIIMPSDVVGPSKPGRRIVILGDNKSSEAIHKAGYQCDILIHEATFPVQLEQIAAKAGHSTPLGAARAAAAMQAKLLVLTHFGHRYPSPISCSEQEMIVRDMRPYYKGDIVFAEDFLTIDLHQRGRNNP